MYRRKGWQQLQHGVHGEQTERHGEKQIVVVPGSASQRGAVHRSHNNCCVDALGGSLSHGTQGSLSGAGAAPGNEPAGAEPEQERQRADEDDPHRQEEPGGRDGLRPGGRGPDRARHWPGPLRGVASPWRAVNFLRQPPPGRPGVAGSYSDWWRPASPSIACSEKRCSSGGRDGDAEAPAQLAREIETRAGPLGPAWYGCRSATEALVSGTKMQPSPTPPQDHRQQGVRPSPVLGGEEGMQVTSTRRRARCR